MIWALGCSRFGVRTISAISCLDCESRSSTILSLLPQPYRLHRNTAKMNKRYLIRRKHSHLHTFNALLHILRKAGSSRKIAEFQKFTISCDHSCSTCPSYRLYTRFYFFNLPPTWWNIIMDSYCVELYSRLAI
jgi:hypothetical protein